MTLTPKGQETLQNVHAAFDAWNRTCQKGFTEEERAQYFAFLHRIAENVAQSRKEGWPDI